ncbi:MAG: TfuA-like protein [Alphaproteobacteria bacterium]
MTAEDHRDAPLAMAALVFLGPTVPEREARALLKAEYRPPARRGDIYRALRDGYTTLLLIDGEFHGSPSVWQREIIDALGEGAVVHGASSMGALRAAELHAFGMVGHGRIFEWYRDGIIDADDEVALIYGPKELGYPSLSEPLVNIRATLSAAVPEILSAAECGQLIEHVKAMHYSERSFDALLAGGPAAAWPAGRRAALGRLAAERRIDQKRQDAIAALASLAAGAAARALPRAGAQASLLFRGERLIAEGLAPTKAAVDAAALARDKGISDADLRALRERLSTLFFVAEWARARGVVATPEDEARARGRLPTLGASTAVRLHELAAKQAIARAAVRAVAETAGHADPPAARRSIVREWLGENGIERAGVGDEALAEWVIAAGPAHFGYLGLDFELVEVLWLLGSAAVPLVLEES